MTVATAFHWLDFPRFYAEARRVAKPDGILACWGYKVLSVTPEVDAVIQRLDAEVLRHFWLPETRLAVEGYRTIPFPFDEIDTPPFRMTHEWNLDQLMGFLGIGLRRTATARRPGENLRTKSVMNWRGRGATHGRSGRSPGICSCGWERSAVVEPGHRSRPRAIVTYFSSLSIPRYRRPHPFAASSV